MIVRVLTIDVTGAGVTYVAGAMGAAHVSRGGSSRPASHSRRRGSRAPLAVAARPTAVPRPMLRRHGRSENLECFDRPSPKKVRLQGRLLPNLGSDAQPTVSQQLNTFYRHTFSLRSASALRSDAVSRGLGAAQETTAGETWWAARAAVVVCASRGDGGGSFGLPGPATSTWTVKGDPCTCAPPMSTLSR